MNISTAIGGKAPLGIWSGKAAQDQCLLREFGSPAYFSAKNGKVNPRAKRFVYLGVKGNSYRLWDPEDKKIVMSRKCHFWRDFIVEVHRLSAGGEDEDQGWIAAGGV